jgi:hypothetical protein
MPDWTWKQPLGVVILELDEFAHGIYDGKCELFRQLQIAYGYGGLPVHIIRYNPDQLPYNSKIPAKDRDHLVLERLRVALDHASVTFDEHSLLKVEYLFYYDIPYSTKDQHTQILKFKDEQEYSEWVDSALPLIEVNADRREYARRARMPIAKANERRARVKKRKLFEEITEILYRIQTLAAEKLKTLI